MYREQTPLLLCIGIGIVCTLLTSVVCNVVWSFAPSFKDNRKKGEPVWEWDEANFMWRLKWLAIAYTAVMILHVVETLTGWEILPNDE